jgi:hypothetical protein
MLSGNHTTIKSRLYSMLLDCLVLTKTARLFALTTGAGLYISGLPYWILRPCSHHSTPLQTTHRIQPEDFLNTRHHFSNPQFVPITVKMCIAVIRYACGAVEHGSDLRPGDVRTCGCNEQKVVFIPRDDNCTHCTLARVELPPTTALAKAKALGLVPADTPEPPRRPDGDDDAEQSAVRMIQRGKQLHLLPNPFPESRWRDWQDTLTDGTSLDSSASTIHSDDKHASPLADSPPISPRTKITMHDNDDSATAIAAPTEPRPSVIVPRKIDSWTGTPMKTGFKGVADSPLTDPAKKSLPASPADYTYNSPTTRLSADNVMKHTTEQTHPSPGGFASPLYLSMYGAERRDTAAKAAAGREQSTTQPRKSGVANDMVDRSATTTVTGVSGNTGVSRGSGSIFSRGEGESSNGTSPSSALAGLTVRHIPMADSQWWEWQQHPLENPAGSSIAAPTAAPTTANTGNTGNTANAPANTHTTAPTDTATNTPVNATAKTTPAPANTAHTATTTKPPATTFANPPANTPANTATTPLNTTANTTDTRSKMEKRKDRKAAERAAAAPE